MESFHKSTAREYFESIVIAVILALFIRTWVVQAFKIPTGSMEKNLLVGDHLLVNKFVFGPIENDVEYRVLPRFYKTGDWFTWRATRDSSQRDLHQRNADRRAVSCEPSAVTVTNRNSHRTT